MFALREQLKKKTPRSPFGSENAKEKRSALDDGLLGKWTMSIRERGELSIARERARDACVCE